MDIQDRYWDAEIETLPWDDVLAWQARQVGPFLETLAARSPFHRDLLGPDAPNIFTDLASLMRLPTTTKQQVRDWQEQRLPGQPFGRHQVAPLEEIVQGISSSGTTGDPVHFALTSNDAEVWGHGIATALFTAGVRRNDVVAHLVGLPGVAGGLPYADGLRRIGATLMWLGGLSTEKIVRALPKVQASVVLATSSFGAYLAEACRDISGREATELGVRNLIGGGEPGLGQPAIRERIRSGWGLEHIHEFMGLGDVMSALWAECDIEEGMHYCGQRSVAVELLAPDGTHQPWEEGVRGEAVYTTFRREATPALRYRSADHMLVVGTSCPCGRTSPRVRCIGRTDDMVIYKGMNVFPSAIRDVVLRGFPQEASPHLRIWKETDDQVRYDHPIPIEIEARTELDEEARTRLARSVEDAVRQQLQVRVGVTILDPGTLPRSAYKTPLVATRAPAP